jgi:hypothetical protein
MGSRGRRKSRDTDPGPTVGEASGIRDGDSVIDHLRRVRPSVYGKPTVEMLQRDLAYLVSRRQS